MSFKDFKKNKRDITKLKSRLQDTEGSKTSFEADPDDWYPQVDKAGNGYAEIRFLPALEATPDTDFVYWISHSFKNDKTGLWYIENSLRTFDEADPVGELNYKLWGSSTDDKSPERQQARNQSQKKNYRANIYVVKDAVNSENNGSIKKFKFGRNFYDKIKEILEPATVGDITPDPVDPFDLFDGATMIIKISTEKKGGKPTRSYSISWSSKGPLANDKKLEEIYNELNSDAERWDLSKYIDRSAFKPYADLKKRLDQVLGYDSSRGISSDSAAKAGLVAAGPTQEADEGETAAPKAAPKSPPKSAPKAAAKTDEDDEEFFNSLASDD